MTFWKKAKLIGTEDKSVVVAKDQRWGKEMTTKDHKEILGGDGTALYFDRGGDYMTTHFSKYHRTLH